MIYLRAFEGHVSIQRATYVPKDGMKALGRDPIIPSGSSALAVAHGHAGDEHLRGAPSGAQYKAIAVAVHGGFGKVCSSPAFAWRGSKATEPS